MYISDGVWYNAYLCSNVYDNRAQMTNIDRPARSTLPPRLIDTIAENKNGFYAIYIRSVIFVSR